MRVVIKKVTKGPRKGQFRFILIANNNEPIANSGSETYHNKKDLIDTLNTYFPIFLIQDKTSENEATS